MTKILPTNRPATSLVEPGARRLFFEKGRRSAAKQTLSTCPVTRLLNDPYRAYLLYVQGLEAARDTARRRGVVPATTAADFELLARNTVARIAGQTDHTAVGTLSRIFLRVAAG